MRRNPRPIHQDSDYIRRVGLELALKVSGTLEACHRLVQTPPDFELLMAHLKRVGEVAGDKLPPELKFDFPVIAKTRVVVKMPGGKPDRYSDVRVVVSPIPMPDLSGSYWPDDGSIKVKMPQRMGTKYALRNILKIGEEMSIVLSHEMTHAADASLREQVDMASHEELKEHEEKFGLESAKARHRRDFEAYVNSPWEVRALMREAGDLAVKRIGSDRRLASMKTSAAIEAVLLESPLYTGWMSYLSPESHRKLRQGMVRHLQDAGLAD